MACEITIYDIQDKIGEEFKNKFKNASVKGGDIFIPLDYQNETTLYGEINSLVKELNDSYTIGRFKDFISFYKANEFGYRVEVRPTEALAEAMTEQEISDELGYDFYMGDFALREQEERDLLFSVRKVPETNQDRVEQPNFTKEGVKELFEENPELANSVYETLGFIGNIIQDNKSYYRGQIEEPTIDKDGNLILYGREDELYKKAGLKSKGVSMTDDLQSAIEYGNGQLNVAMNLASESYDSDIELERLSTEGYWLIQIPKNISNEIVKEAGEVKIIGDKIIIPKGQYKIEQVVEGLETQITPEQKQQALQAYSQYLEQGGSQVDIQGFKDFVSNNQNTYLQIASDLINPAIEELDKFLLDFLKEFNVKTKKFEELKSRLGVDALGATDVLNKLIWYVENRNEETLPEESAHMLVALMGENHPEIKELLVEITNWSEYESIKNQYLPIYKDERKVKIEAVGKLIAKSLVKNYKANGLDNNKLRRALRNIIESIKRILNSTNLVEVFRYNESIADKIAINVLSGNKDYIYKIKNRNPNVNAKKEIDNNPNAKKIINTFSSNNVKLTGSLAIAGTENIRRPKGQGIHDIDFKVKSFDTFNNEVLSKLPENAVPAHYGWHKKDYSTFAYLIPSEGYRIEVIERKDDFSNGFITDYALYDENNKKVPVTQQNVISVDFFVYKEGVDVKDFDFTSEYIPASLVYEGKMSLGGKSNPYFFNRDKDQEDYVLRNPKSFIPFSDHIYYQLPKTQTTQQQRQPNILVQDLSGNTYSVNESDIITYETDFGPIRYIVNENDDMIMLSDKNTLEQNPNGNVEGFKNWVGSNQSDSPNQLFSGRRAPIDTNNIDTTEEALLVIENIMKNQESVLGRTKDDRYYIINNRKYARVSDTLPNDFDGDTSLYENSRVAGNTVDTIVRDFFSGNLKSSYIGISNEAKESLLKRLESIKEKIDSRGEVFLTNNIVLFNDELGVAGEVDILSVDKDGNFHLYDVKTTKKGSLKWYDTSYKGKMTKRNRHSLQLSAYNNLFEYQYGKKFKRMGIIPFELVYDEAGHIHGLNEADFIPHTYNTAVEQYIPKKNQQKTEEENFQERAYRKQQQEEQEYDPNEPLGDNYFELVNWKNKELEKIEKEKKRLKTILKYRDTSENRAILKNLEAKQKTIENQLQQLSHKEIDYMFHAILEDLYDLELALKSGSMHDIQNVKEKIDYYREFIKTLPNHPDFKPISEKVVRLEALQSKRNREKLMEELENSDLIKNVLDNLNKDITDPNDKYTIEDLLVANADIPWTDREFLGLISSNTGDTVLPQYLFAKFRTSLMRNTNTATDFVDKLQAYLQKHGAGEREWIYERDSMGGKTGRLIDVFSENWLEELSERNRLLRNYRTSLYETGENISQNYDEIIDWYTSKAVVVDFTRLSAVKDIYGTNPEYAKYFEKSTDEKIARYENNLKKQLGPRFNDVVDQILNKLSKFEELKQDDSIDPIWRNRTIASYNVWEFLDNYKKGLTGPINYKWEKGTSSVYFSPEAFSDLTILPINKISKVYYNSEGLREVEETDSGFYNEEYQKILNDPVKLEYWSIMKDMSEYVRDTYGLRDQGLTYAKIQDAYAERLLQDLDFLKKNPKLKNLKKLFLDGAREYKSFFYEQGTYSTEKGIRSNYSDTSRVEISKLSKTYILQGMKPKEAYKKARREVLENYTPNLNNAMKAAVLEAAVQNARLETESLSEGLLDVFKSIKARDEKGEATVERVNAISRLEAYIDKVILNRSTKYRDSKDLFGRTISDQGWLEKILTELGGDSKVIKQIKEADLTKYLSEADKKILENLRGLKGGNYSGEFKIETTLDGETVTLKRNYDKSQGYFYTLNSKEITKDEFDELFDEYIDKEISNIGLDLNMAGLLDGVLKSVILSGLGLNPISGIFNRIEGKHSAMIMDLTGEYWTTGNIDHANQFLAFSNLIRLSPFKVPRKYKDKQVQIQIFQEVLDRFQVLQDRKRENERVMRSNRMDRNLLNIFQFAVDNPEFKNQGAIMLSVMMDTKIFDNNGNEYKFFDPETMAFPAFNFEEGTISIKPEFSDSFSFNTPEMERMVLKIEDAVSHSQGNYNQHDIMKIKRGVWGRALTTFMTWFPEQVNQRWGTRTTGDELNINLFTGKERRDGRYVEAWKTSKPAFLTFVLTSLGISYGMLGMAGIIGTGIIGAIVYQKFLKKVTANTQREVNYIKEMVEFLKSLLIETLNYPSRTLNTSDKFRIKNRSFENTTMSEQDIAALRAITRELAIMLSLLSVKLAYGMLRYDDDDDKESSKRMRYNFVQNQLSRGINALSTYTNPHSLVTDHSRIALLSHLENIWKILDGTLFDPNIEKAKEGFLGFSPLPNILTKGTLPWENKMVYDEMTGFTGITPPMKWTQEFIKDFDTGGEYSAKKDYNEARKEIRDKLKKNAIKKYGSNKNVVKAVVDAKMRLEIGSKPSELTYKEAYAKITKGEKLEPVRRIRRPKPRNVLIQELAERLEELGVPRAEAKKIAMEELK